MGDAGDVRGWLVVRQRPVVAAAGRPSSGAGSSSTSRRPRRTSAPATTASGSRSSCCNRVAVEAVEGDGSIELTTTGEGAGELGGDRSNRFVAGLEMALEAAFGEPRPASIGWRIAAHNRIPLSRGLGSSSAAAVGGAGGRATRSVAAGCRWTALLRIATEIEGHPDNAAAALLGGFVVSAHLGERVEAVRFDAPDGLRAVLFIPERRLSTADMRRVLPAEVPLRDAVEQPESRRDRRRRDRVRAASTCWPTSPWTGSTSRTAPWPTRSCRA